MGGLIRPDTRQPPGSGPKSVFVNGVRFANSAAKFWPSLIDEVGEEFPACGSMELESVGAGPLDRHHLHPELELRDALFDLAIDDVRSAIRNTIAEMEMLGPPGGVSIRLLDGSGGELMARDLPEESIDADIFPYLLVWLLEWGGMRTDRWNDAEVAGSFTAVDRGRGIVYGISFVLRSTHVSEGLYRRCVTVVPAVSALA